MIKTNIKKTFLNILAIGTLLAAWNISTVSAAYNPIPRDLCTLMVKPFDSSKPATTGPAGDQYINYLDYCKNFVTYPNEYKPQPPKEVNNPLKAGSESKNLPITRHDHKYYNDTVYDNNYYYKAYMDRFEITLESDGLNSINSNEIKCQTPYPSGFDTTKMTAIEDCSGTVNDLWGGTTVSKTTVGNNIVVTWDFAQVASNGNYLGRPVIWANNGKNFPEGDFTDENDRKLEFNVHLTSKDNDEIWSATTSSRTLIADLAISKGNYTSNSGKGCTNPENINDSQNGWCYLKPSASYPTENVFTTAQKTFYWFPIGSVATVWREPPPPPPNTCQALSIKLTPNTVVINGKNSYPIKVDSLTFTPQNQVPQGAKVKWTADDPNGEFWRSAPGGTYEKIGTGTVTVDNVNLQLYYIGEKPTQVKAELTGIPDSQLGSSCYAYVQIPIEEIRCKELKVDHPQKIYANTVSVLNSQGFGTDNKNFPNKIKYWVNPGYGEFYLMKPNNIPDNPSANISEINPGNNALPFVFDNAQIVINPNVLIAGNAQGNAANAAINIIDELISGQFGIEDISINISDLQQLQDFAVKDLIEIPQWMTQGMIPEPFPTPDPGPEEMTPESFGQTNSLLAVNFNIEPAFTQPVLIDSDNSGSIIAPGAISPAGAIDFNLTPESALGPIINMNLFESITVDAGTPVYFWAKKPGKAVVHVQVVDTENPGCKRDFDIVPELPYCKNINLLSDPISPLTVDQPAIISIQPVDQNGNSLVNTTKFNLSTTAGGKFIDNSATQFAGQTTLGKFPIQFKESNKAGKVTVEINKTDPTYSSTESLSCKGEIEVIEVPPQPVQACLKFDDLNLLEFGSDIELEKLDPGKVYTVETGLSTELESNDTITYTIEKQYGAFIKVGPQLMPVIAAMIKSLPTEALTVDFLSLNLPADSLTYEITVPEYEPVLLITFINPPASITNALQVKATNFSEDECTKLFPLVIPEQPKDCKSIELSPFANPFDPKVANIFNITGDYKDYEGEIKITISSTTAGSKPTISKIGGQPVTDSITFSKDELKDQAIAKSFAYNPNGYDEDADSLTITVDAINSANAACKKTLNFPAKGKVNECIDLEIIEPDSPWEIDDNDDEQLFQISVDTNPSDYEDDLYYNWEVIESGAEWEGDNEHVRDQGDFTQILEDFDEDTEVEVWASTGDNKDYIKDSSGEIICRDTISVKQAKEEKEKPEIEKFAYPENNADEADDTINIKGKMDSNDTNSEETNFVTYVIKFTVGTDIKEAKIWDSELKPNGIIENIYADSNGKLDFDNNNMRIIFVDDDDETLVFNSKNYQDKDYEENACDNSNSPCIEVNDKSPTKKEFRDYIVNKFSKGDQLTFKNLDKSKVETIRIEYEMTYKNPITDQICKDLVAACGEQFKNEANFTSKSKTSNKTYEGDATTKVIAICPYILTRQGGDVFFHDVIETGIDVAQCSEVKSCDGPCIVPEPPPTPGTPKTGAGDIPENFINLKLPSHDVCRYSNSADNLKGYDNVLKNFSSTICELQADISKAWTKKNITDSINANVKRISRWEENLNINNLRSVDALDNLSNSKSGVFVRKSGDLKINGIDGYTIQSTKSVPAAQTYIVIGYDLYINSDINYGQTDYTKSKQIPSAAFIVIDGNIIIDNSVEQIDGILMAVDLDGSGDGKVKNPQLEISSYVTLTINGNLIGDVYDLFYSRRGVGDPLKDQGSVTIRYDERILLNTPPGINELINLKQAIVP